MFYNKKYPENKDKVLLSDIDREDRIEEGFNNVETEFRNVKETINEKFSDMIDYPVEVGSTYTKWKSGRLEMYLQVSNAVMQEGNNSIEVPLPVEMAGSYFTNSVCIATVISTSNGWLPFDVKRTIPKNRGTYTISGVSTSSGTVSFQVMIEARWK